jgi:hypothetical protein
MELNIFNLKITTDMLYIIILIIYISLLSIYTPRHWLSLINHAYVKFAILLFVFYTICFDDELMLGIFILVALVVTINMDNSIQAAKATYKSELLIKETFENDDKKDNDNKTENYVNDEEDNEQYTNMMSDKTLKDTFSVLHQSIHELEKMVNNKKSQ